MKASVDLWSVLKWLIIMIGTDVAHVVFAHLYVKKLYFPLSLNANLRNSAVENHLQQRVKFFLALSSLWNSWRNLFGIYERIYEENIEIFWMDYKFISRAEPVDLVYFYKQCEYSWPAFSSNSEVWPSLSFELLLEDPNKFFQLEFLVKQLFIYKWCPCAPYEPKLLVQH